MAQLRARRQAVPTRLGPPKGAGLRGAAARRCRRRLTRRRARPQLLCITIPPDQAEYDAARPAAVRPAACSVNGPLLPPGPRPAARRLLAAHAAERVASLVGLSSPRGRVEFGWGKTGRLGRARRAGPEAGGSARASGAGACNACGPLRTAG